MTEPRTQDPTAGHGRPIKRPGGTPRWVKAFGAALGVLVLAFLALHLTGLSPMGHH